MISVADNTVTVRQARLLRSMPLVWAIILLIALVSIPLHLDHTSPDVSWLITVAEKVMAGKTLYVDILETNPPLPALLYLPAVVGGRAVGLSPETALIIIVYVAGLLTLLLTAWILGTGKESSSTPHFQILLAAAVILFILPSDAFAQRDYIAAMFALPMMAVFIAHADSGEWARPGARVIATVLAAFTLAIKPPIFALPGLFVFVFYLAKTRSLKFSLTSGIVPAGVLAVLITAGSLAVFPQYFGKVWDLVLHVYVPAKSYPLAFLKSIGFLSVAACVVIIMRGNLGTTVRLLQCAASGFLAAYLVEGKWFAYQLYPAAFFTFLATTTAISRQVSAIAPAARVARIIAAGLGALALVAISAAMLIGFRDKGVETLGHNWGKNFQHATMLMITPDHAMAFPLVRQLKGDWVGRTHSEWVARYTLFMLDHYKLAPARRQELLNYHQWDLKEVLQCIAEKKPEIIIVDVRPQRKWLIEELRSLKPDFLAAYTLVAREGPVNVFRRSKNRTTAK